MFFAIFKILAIYYILVYNNKNCKPFNLYLQFFYMECAEMKIKSGFYLKNINGQTVVMSENTAESPINSIVLGETATFLWECLSKSEMGKEQLLNALLDRFEISTVLALNDIDVFVKTLRENGIIE